MLSKPQHLTITFNIDPELNDGYTEAFNQCGEPWWWVITPSGPAAGPVNFKGATLKQVWDGVEL